ncbi:hypothetical protein AAF712_010477 [Marasmius tenuissimus]|uniref:Arylamine N-acetyltransferase n=1 Tax=Marasmius tenuissimus TaxID=585030 RepID=A0ABR2ZLT5_9AGAR
MASTSYIKSAPSVYSTAQVLQWLQAIEYPDANSSSDAVESQLREGKFPTTLENLTLLNRLHLLAMLIDKKLSEARHGRDSRGQLSKDGGREEGLVLLWKEWIVARDVARFGISEPEYSPLTHLVLFVQPFEGKDERKTYLVDTAFGGGGLVRPILLEDGATVAGGTSSETFKLSKGPHPKSVLDNPAALYWILAVQHQKDPLGPPAPWKVLFSFSEAESFQSDIEPASYFVATHPEGNFFLQQVVCVRYVYLDDKKEDLGYTTLWGNLTRQHMGAQTRDLPKIKTEEERLERIREFYGIDVGEDVEHIKGRNAELKAAKKNDARGDKDLKYVRAQEERPASPQESEYSIDSDDCEDLVNSKEKLEKAKTYMDEDLYAALVKKREEKEGGSAGKSTDLMRAPRIVEVEESVASEIEVPFHKYLFQVVNYHHTKAASLGFFLNRNLEKINANSATIRWDKLPGHQNKDNKTRVWEKKHIYEILEINPKDTHEGLKTYADFTEAMKNLVRFEKARDPDGESGAYSTWIDKHKNFFERQEQAQELFDQWKPKELELRERRFLKGFVFSEITYLLAWSEVKSEAKSMKNMHDILEVQMAPLREGRDKKRKEYGGRDDGKDQPYRPRKPFQGGNAGGSSNLRCLGCGARGHNVRHHDTSSHPPLVWAAIKDESLVHPSNSKVICLRYNIHGHSKSDSQGKCSDCKAEHVCCYCGKTDHYGAKCSK